jgi:phospholipid transport system substrate-binding protein
VTGLSSRSMRARWYGVLTLVVGFELIMAEPAAATSPTEVLEAFFARANAILRSVDPLGDMDQPRQAIRDLVNDIFDFRGASALALGSVWLSRTPEDQAEFVRLFGVFLERGFIATIASKASVANGVRIEYFGESINDQSAGVATTLLTRGGHELPVDYWFVRRGESWKVQDVVIDGVSLVANYRAQFARILGAYTYSEIIARMGGSPPAAAGIVAATVPNVQAKPVVPAIPPVTQSPPPVTQSSWTAQAVTPPVPPAPPAAAALAPRTRQEIQLVALPSEVPPPERLRAPAGTQAPATAANAEPARERGAAGPYWVQLGAFQSADSAGHLADRFRRDGATISQFWLTNASGNRVGVWARVRLGPFANRSDALSKVKQLTARGQTSFIAGARD